MNLYFKYVKVQLMSQMSHKKSFILLCIGQFFIPFTVFLSMTMLFQRFGHIKGWTLYEVCLSYGILNIANATCVAILRGFDSFSILVRDGSFDRIMLRPRNTVLQVLGSRFELTRIGRLVQGIIVFIIALNHLNLDWTLFKVFILFSMFLSGFFIFSGIYILGATLCFFTVQGIEIINIFTDGGREMSKYPLGIYKDFIRLFFTFVIPFGAVNFYPLLYILGKSNDIRYALSPLFSCLFILPCLYIWSRGVKHYTSTGS